MEQVVENDSFKSVFGRRLRLLREMNEVTQVQLAEAIGMSSTGSISQIEAGNKGMKMSAVLKAAGFLGVHPVVLMSPSEFGKDELEVLAGIMKLMEKRSKNPRRAEPCLFAIKKLLQE